MNRKTQKKTDKKKKKRKQRNKKEKKKRKTEDVRICRLKCSKKKKRRVKQGESNSVQFTRFVENERCEIVNRRDINNNCIHGDATTVHRKL